MLSKDQIDRVTKEFVDWHTGRYNYTPKKVEVINKRMLRKGLWEFWFTFKLGSGVVSMRYEAEIAGYSTSKCFMKKYKTIRVTEDCHSIIRSLAEQRGSPLGDVVLLLASHAIKQLKDNSYGENERRLRGKTQQEKGKT